jgi:two-component system, LytTR family, sensor kinase
MGSPARNVDGIPPETDTHDTPIRVSTDRRWGVAGSFLLWTVIGLLSCAHDFASGRERPNDHNFWHGIFTSLLCAYLWALLTPVVFRLQRQLPLRQSSYIRNASMLLIFGIGLSYLSSRFTFAAGLALDGLFGDQLKIPDSYFAVSPGDLFLELLVYGAILGASFLLQGFLLFHEQRIRLTSLALEKSRLDSSLKESELESLRMRLNPHFLFNALQNISALTRQEPGTARQMLIHLAGLMRSMFRGEDYHHERSLRDELEFLSAYVDLEKMRFGGRLRVIMDINPDALEAAVPVFLLQPLVENAIQHGVGSVPGPGTIRIQAAVREHQLMICVADSGRGIPMDGFDDLELGVGLGSTLERLKRLYPGCHSVTLSRAGESGTEIQLLLPCGVASRNHPTTAGLRVRI